MQATLGDLVGRKQRRSQQPRAEVEKTLEESVGEKGLVMHQRGNTAQRIAIQNHLQVRIRFRKILSRAFVAQRGEDVGLVFGGRSPGGQESGGLVG